MGTQPARLTHSECGLEARRAYTVPTFRIFPVDKKQREYLNKGERDAERVLGYEQNFIAVDPTDKKALGVTDEGLAEQEKKHTELGWREPKRRTF